MKWTQIQVPNQETCLICPDCEVAHALYYPVSKKLVITQKDKDFDDHAIARFENLSLEGASKIIEHLSALTTA